MTRIQPTGQPITCTSADTPGTVAYGQQRTGQALTNITAAALRQLVTDHPVVTRSITTYELNALDEAEVADWAKALGIAVPCTAYLCQARDGASRGYHATQAEVDECTEASDEAEQAEYEQEQATERAWQMYDECGAFMGH